jgi:hypothetical protein
MVRGVKLTSDLSNRAYGAGALVGVTGQTRAGGTREPVISLKQIWSRLRGLGRQPAHSVIDTRKSGQDRGYVLQRKNEPGQIRLELMSRLRPAQAPKLAPGAPVPPPGQPADGPLAGAGADQPLDAPREVQAQVPAEETAPPTLADRTARVADMAQRLASLQGAPAHRQRAELISERKVALQEVAGEMARLDPAADAPRLRELTQTLLALYLPDAHQAFLGGRTWGEVGADLPRPTQGPYAPEPAVTEPPAGGRASVGSEATQPSVLEAEGGSARSSLAGPGHSQVDPPALTPEQRYQQRIDHQESWPAVSVAPDAFQDSLGSYLAQLARSGQLNDRLLERAAERSIATTPGGAFPGEAPALRQRLSAADTFHALRATLAPLADPQFVSSIKTGERSGLDAQLSGARAALQQAQAAGDWPAVSQAAGDVERIERSLRALNLTQYGQMVDSFCEGDAGMAATALALKQQAVDQLLPEQDHATGRAFVEAQHAQSQARAALGDWQVSIQGNRWLFGLAGRSRSDTALVRGAQAGTVIDEKLISAVIGISESPADARTLRMAGGDNTRAVALMIAHQINLQRRLEGLQTQLRAGAAEAGDAPHAINPAAADGADLAALAKLFDDADLRRLGFAAERIRALRSASSQGAAGVADIGLDELRTAADALYRLGLNSTEKVDTVNRLIERTIKQVVVQSNASQNARDITSMMPIAVARRLVDLAEGVTVPQDQAADAGAPQPADGPLRTEQAQRLSQARQAFTVQRNLMAKRHDQLRQLDESVALAQADLSALPAAARPRVNRTADLQAAALLAEFRELTRAATDNATGLAELEARVSELEALPDAANDPRIAVQKDMIIELRQAASEIDTRRSELARAIHGARDSAFGRMIWPAGTAPRQPIDAQALAMRLDGLEPAAAPPEPVDSASAAAATRAPGPLGAVRAFITLATEAAQRKVLVGDIQTRSAAMQQALADHRQAMRPEVAAAAQTILRAVIAEQYLAHAERDRNGAAGGSQAPMLPIEREQEILAALKARGVDRDVFGPEIDDMLMREIGPETVQAWAREAAATQRQTKVAAAGGTAAAKLAEERAIAREAIISAVRDMQFAERIKLTEKSGMTLSSGRVPIALTGLRAEIAASKSSRTLLDIKCKGEKFVVVMRGSAITGAEAGLSWMPPMPGLAKIAAVTGKVSGSHEAAEGVAMTFPSRADTIAFITALYTRDSLEAADWARATNIEFTTKKVLAASVNAAANISTRNIGNALSGVNKSLGNALKMTASAEAGPVGAVEVGLNVSAGVRFKMGGQWEEASLSNNKKVVLKTASAYQMGLSLQAGVTLRHPNLMSQGAQAIEDATTSSIAGPGDITLSKMVPPNAFNLIGAEKELFDLNFQVELATEQTAVDGQLEKAELEIFCPLMPGLNAEKLARLVPGYADKLDRLSPEQRQQLDALLDKVDTDQGHGILINMALKTEYRDALNAGFSLDKQAASVADRPADARTRTDAAYRDHQQRLAQLKRSPEAFELSQVIVVASDMMFRTLNTNLTFIKFSKESSAMNGRTVGRIAMNEQPAAPAPPPQAASSQAEALRQDLDGQLAQARQQALA